MARRPSRVWIVGLALIGVWVLTYWLTPARRKAPPEPGEVRVSFQAPPEAPPAHDESDPAVPDDGPGEPADAPGPEPGAVIPPSYTLYTVLPGETLTSISQKMFGTEQYADAIARMNGSSVDPMRLGEGQQIKIPVDPRNVQGIPADPDLQPSEPDPGFTEYIVTRNDTLSDIAKAVYGRPSLWTRIRDANPRINREGTNIRPGWKLVIPPPP